MWVWVGGSNLVTKTAWMTLLLLINLLIVWMNRTVKWPPHVSFCPTVQGDSVYYHIKQRKTANLLSLQVEIRQFCFLITHQMNWLSKCLNSELPPFSFESAGLKCYRDIGDRANDTSEYQRVYIIGWLTSEVKLGSEVTGSVDEII